MTYLRRALSLSAGLGLIAFSAASLVCAATAQNYPSRPVKIVVPFPAGGPTDLAARLLAQQFAASMNQPFIVENRPGASGNIGTDAVAKAPPDGYTLLVSPDTPLTVNSSLFAKLPFDSARDFAPIATLASFSLTLVVHPSIPVRSLAEFVAYAKTHKEGPLLYGSGGAGGDPGHLTMEYFRMQTGFEAQHVSFRGNAEVVTGLVGGHVKVGFLATPGVLPHVRSGRLKALAVSSAQRTPPAQDIPTVAESGNADFDVRFYMIMLAPAGTPEPIRATLEREVQRAMGSPDLQARLQAQGLQPIASTGLETGVLLNATAKRWKSVIQSAQIRRK
jgi:tripartite-type tricarboxylate transporter receptor subunit TctC